MHKMFRVTTEKGEYAVKVLNPDIMKRERELKNMICAEQISSKFKSENSLIAEKEISGQHVVESCGFYFMVFELEMNVSVFNKKIAFCKFEGWLLDV